MRLEKTKFYIIGLVRLLTKIIIYWIIIAFIIPLLYIIGKRIYRKYPNFHFTIPIDKKGNRIKVFLLSICNLFILFTELITLFTIFIYIGFKFEQNKSKKYFVSNFKEYLKSDKKAIRSKF